MAENRNFGDLLYISPFHDPVIKIIFHENIYDGEGKTDNNGNDKVQSCLGYTGEIPSDIALSKISLSGKVEACVICASDLFCNK